MKSPRRTKSLAALARSVKDSDEFVTHICNIAAAFGRHHAVDAVAGREVRQALRIFTKHAAALADWLRNAGRASGIERQALRQIGMASGDPGALSQSEAMCAWLTQMAEASAAAAQSTAATAREDALRAAAEGLRATFEHHRIRLSQRAPQQLHSDAVRLLCAVVNGSQADGFEPAEAKQWLRSVRQPTIAGAVRPHRRAKRR